VHTIQQAKASHPTLDISQAGEPSEVEAEWASQLVVRGEQGPILSRPAHSAPQRAVSSQAEVDWERDHPEGQVDTRLERGWTLILLWNFGVGAVDPKPEHDATIERIAAGFRGNTQDVLNIEGHASSSGSHTQNLAISRQRAQRARAHLAALGVWGSQMVAVGLGDSAPFVPNTSPENMARNRCVAISGALLT